MEDLENVEGSDEVNAVRALPADVRALVRRMLDDLDAE